MINIHMVDKLNIVPQVRLCPKGLNARGLKGQLGGQVADWAAGAITDVVGDTVSDAIGGGLLGSVVGSEIGSVLGGFAEGALGNVISSDAAGAANGPTSMFQGPARVLSKTKGIIFPNTPSIETGHTTDWSEYDLAHTNYAYWAFNKSRPKEIVVSAKFGVNTRAEADYWLGCVHFLRIATKMHFGVSDAEFAGTPPPILEFFGLGENMFSGVPVIVTSFSTALEDNVDYVSAGPLNGGTFVPVINTMTLSLQPYYNPSEVHEKFSLEKFKRGGLVRNKGYL